MSDSKIISALQLIGKYGGYDGAHHKQWVLDQVARILAGEGDEGYARWRRSADADWEDWDEGITP